MNNYKKIVFLSIGLSAVLLMGAVNALFMTPRTEWFENLIMPRMNAGLHSVFWLVNYYITAGLIAEFLSNAALQKRFWVVLIIYLGNIAWCAAFFRFYHGIAAFVILLLQSAAALYSVFLTTKHTKYTGFIAAVLACWYLYLTGMNLFVLLVN